MTVTVRVTVKATVRVTVRVTARFTVRVTVSVFNCLSEPSRVRVKRSRVIVEYIVLNYHPDINHN